MIKPTCDIKGCGMESETRRNLFDEIKSGLDFLKEQREKEHHFIPKAPVEIDYIYLSSLGKRYKGKKLIRTRKIKVEQTVILPVVDNTQEFTVTGEVKKKQCLITFKGTVSLKTGEICVNFNSKFASYLKKKKFSIVGYDLQAVKENTNKPF